ncbi:hypothetical protein FJZ20_00980 [Candidatus Pacearchaeota archaeon]|nr:hypothetical protein [Candidatus Pacearchaeota archaeon]
MKRGQMNLSFGMIFSIILIVIFLVFGFYAIKAFLKFQDSATKGKFFDELKADVDRVWKSAESSQERTYFLPSKIVSVCFVDFSSSAIGRDAGIYSELKKTYYGTENLVLYPIGSSEVESIRINNIDLIEMTKNENPFCIETNKGKLILTLSKNFNDALVTVKR